MKPKFALDLSHEGINLLHRSKGGWSLVGTVDLDDPEMGTHLADLRRRAAALESGGVTCKIIIPNSQILYTTLEAPGPDDIAREVQIRSGLDGLTPYPVGELVFDWRAAGERARVAVLARDTMDEAETFAVEHRFNPVSFVARPPQGEFSGEPFFGKTRAATKILGPSERVEPDPSPVPHKPAAMASVPRFAASSTPDTGTRHGSDTPAAPAPHSPGTLAWEPPKDPVPEQAPKQAPEPAPQSEPVRETREPQRPTRPQVDPSDDPFAELDAIQAELSGDPEAASSFRARVATAQTDRPTAPSGRGADQPAPPPLAPFPPTSDEADALPAAPQPARKPRSASTPTRDTTAPASGISRPGTGTPSAPRPQPPAAAKDAGEGVPSRGIGAGESPSAATGKPDDTPSQPGVAFSTRRNGNTATTTAAPTARSAADDSARSTPPQDARSAPAEPSSRSNPPAASPQGDRRDMSPSDKRRADMAAALARPLPGTPAAQGSDKPGGNKAGEKPSGRTSISGAMRGAADGLRSFGQRRGQPGPGNAPVTTPENEAAPRTEVRGSTAAPTPKPDASGLLAPNIAAPDDRDAPEADKPMGPAANETQVSKPPSGAPSAPGAKQAQPADIGPSKAQKPEKPAPSAEPTPAQQPAPKPIPAIATRTVAPPMEKVKAPASEAEALTVFGARRTAEQRGSRKYLGVILTLLLLLAMAVIAMWSSFFVDDGDPALFNPGDGTVVPETGDPAVQPSTDTPPDATPEAPATDETGADSTTTPAPDEGVALAPQVLSQEEAEAQYADTQIWQRAPESLGEPFTPGLEIGEVGGPGAGRSTPAEPDPTTGADAPVDTTAAIERAAPVPPPPADTVFELDQNGLVAPSPEGTVGPSGVVVFEGTPDLVPPARPAPPALPEAEPGAAPAGDPVVPGDALEQAVEEALEDLSGVEAIPDTPPVPRPDDAPSAETAALEAQPTETDGPEVTGEQDVAATLTDAVATGEATPEDVVNAVATTIVDATELAVATSLKPTRRPDDIDQIVNAAMARAAAAPPVAAAPATTTPAIPTSASVANQATTPNALDLREINLLGISGPSNARRALVRMANGRYITVKVGDRLDGGRVTSITSDGLTYQKGSRNFSLQLLPLG